VSPLMIFGAVMVIAVGVYLGMGTFAAFITQGLHGPSQSPAKASTTPVSAQASPGAGAPLVAPTPAIPLPKSCPENTLPQVDNPARYGFCTPAGWGAWNNNNQIETTQLIKARQGDTPIILPTDFDRIQILVNLNTANPGDSAPPECRGAPNDSIDGLATHHCSAPLDPENNPYHANRAEFWMVDLFQDRRFYMTALIPADATPDDDATINLIVHSVKPPGSS